MDLHGKVAVVTGASSGIGESAARFLAAAGMEVIGVARRGDRLETLAASTEGIHPFTADVTDDEDVAGLAAWVGTQHGACHVLVNNAGIGVRQGFAGWDDRSAMAHAMDVNYLSGVRCMGAFAELLRTSAPSRVINVASVAGKLAVEAPGYAASKFALVAFTEAVGLDWAEHGVTVSQVNPGFIHTEGFPQDTLMGSGLTRRLVGRPDMVGRAIRDVARTGTRERTVPRWYRLFVVLRHVAPPAYWAMVRRRPF